MVKFDGTLGSLERQSEAACTAPPPWFTLAFAFKTKKQVMDNNVVAR